jgi:hypothetical protein
LGQNNEEQPLEGQKNVHRGGKNRALRRFYTISGNGEAELFLKITGCKGVVLRVFGQNNAKQRRGKGRGVMSKE